MALLMSALTPKPRIGSFRRCLRAFRAFDIPAFFPGRSALNPLILIMHHLQPLLQRAIDAQEAALAEGLRFLDLGDHPAAARYRTAIGELSGAIWIDAAGETALSDGTTKHMLSAPVFLGGSHKSGTTLLRNLLDGHPEISVLPTDGFGVRFHRRISRFEPEHRGLAMVAAAVANLAMPIAGESPRWILGKAVEPYLRIGTILRELTGSGSLSDTASCMRGFADLFYRLSPRQSTVRYWAEKSTFNVQDAPLLARLFPDGKFIHIVRHPGAIVAAQKRKQPMKERSFCFQRECEEVFSSLAGGIRNQRRLSAGSYHLVNYEQLLSNPDKEMERICTFLEVGFDECLLKPTVFGQPAGSNTSRLGSSSCGAGKLSTAPGEKWRSELDGDEQDLIRFLFRRVLGACNYNESFSISLHGKGAARAVRNHVAGADRMGQALARWTMLALKGSRP